MSDAAHPWWRPIPIPRLTVTIRALSSVSPPIVPLPLVPTIRNCSEPLCTGGLSVSPLKLSSTRTKEATLSNPVQRATSIVPRIVRVRA